MEAKLVWSPPRVGARRAQHYPAQHHNDAIAGREWPIVCLLSIGQQDACMRNIDLEGRPRDHELSMRSRTARVAVGRFDGNQIALDRRDASLYYEEIGRGRYLPSLGLDSRSHQAAKHRQNYRGCQQGCFLTPAYYCVEWHGYCLLLTYVFFAPSGGLVAAISLSWE